MVDKGLSCPLCSPDKEVRGGVNLSFPTPQKEMCSYFFDSGNFGREISQIEINGVYYSPVYIQISSMAVVHVTLSFSALYSWAAFLSAHPTVIPSFLIPEKGSICLSTASKDALGLRKLPKKNAIFFKYSLTLKLTLSKKSRCDR